MPVCWSSCLELPEKASESTSGPPDTAWPDFFSQGLGHSVRPFLFIGCALAESGTLETSPSVSRTCVQSWSLRVAAGAATPAPVQPQLEERKERDPWGSGDLAPNCVPATDWQNSWQVTCHF